MMLDARFDAPRPARAAATRCPHGDARRATVVASTPTHLAAYAHVCGFPLRDELPADLPARARVPAAHGR